MKKLVSLFLISALMLSLCAFAGAQAAAYTAEDLMIDDGDHQIPATLTMPALKKGELCPAVVMLHGNGSNRHEAGNGYDLLAPKLAEAGIASLRFDYIGNGDSATDYIEFTHEKGVQDALRVLEYLITLPGIDSARVGIMGWSQGGGLALVAASREESFKSVLTWAGALYDGAIDEAQYETAKKDGYYESTYEWRGPLKLSPEYFEVLRELRVADAVPLIKAPILAINGADDDVVPPASAETIAKLAVNEKSAAFIMEGADHTFRIFTGDMTVFNALMDKTVEWFKETL